MTTSPAPGFGHAGPNPPAPVPEVTQLTLGVAETPAGQRVVLTMSMLLKADEAKAFAAQLAEVAGQLSATRLVVASSLNGGGISG